MRRHRSPTPQSISAIVLRGAQACAQALEGCCAGVCVAMLKVERQVAHLHARLLHQQLAHESFVECDVGLIAALEPRKLNPRMLHEQHREVERRRAAAKLPKIDHPSQP